MVNKSERMLEAIGVSACASPSARCTSTTGRF